MKIIKFKKREKFKYKRKVIIKDLTLKILVGIHNFEKKNKQRVKFNIEILTDPYVSPNSKDLNSILNYEEVVMQIEKLSNLCIPTKIFKVRSLMITFLLYLNFSFFLNLINFILLY